MVCVVHLLGAGLFRHFSQVGTGPVPEVDADKLLPHVLIRKPLQGFQ